MTGPVPEAQASAYERLFEHGGDINSASSAFPDAPKPWIDLSTGVNPLAYPIGELPVEAWTRLPAPGEIEALRRAAALRYGAAAQAVVAAPGTQSLLQWLPRLFPASRVAVLGPTYGEHEKCWRQAGAAVEVVDDLSATSEADVVVVVNPNNPDGRLLTSDRLRAFAQTAARKPGLLIVDEAFMDLSGQSVASEPPPCAIVLRSFGKTYGLAGLRLGFAVTDPARAAQLRAALGPWAISGAAVEIGRRALADDAWLARTAARLAEDCRWLDAALAQAGFATVGGTPLFRLVRHADAARRFARLCAAGILARPFATRPDWLRFAIPRREDRKRVGEALLALR